MPCGRGPPRTSSTSGGSLSGSRFWKLPWESATTNSLAPASRAAAIAALASWVISSRKAA